MGSEMCIRDSFGGHGFAERGLEQDMGHARADPCTRSLSRARPWLGSWRDRSLCAVLLRCLAPRPRLRHCACGRRSAIRRHELYPHETNAIMSGAQGWSTRQEFGKKRLYLALQSLKCWPEALGLLSSTPPVDTTQPFYHVVHTSDR